MENKYYLFTPKLDWLLIGGAALIFYVILIVINMIYGVNVYWQSEIVYLMLLLAFFVNSPHFIISYEIFYSSVGEKILKKKCFLFNLLR